MWFFNCATGLQFIVTDTRFPRSSSKYAIGCLGFGICAEPGSTHHLSLTCMAGPVALAGLFFMVVPVYQQCFCKPVYCPVVTLISWSIFIAVCGSVDDSRNIRVLGPVVFAMVATDQHIGHNGDFISIVVFTVFACFRAGR